MLSNLMQGGEVDLDQHRNDHDPDQQADGQIDPCQFHRSDGLEQRWKHLPQGDTGDDAQPDPQREIALETIHGVGVRGLVGGLVGAAVGSFGDAS